MNVYYNPEGIGNVLIIPIEEGDRYDIVQEKIGDITRISDHKGTILGYNIFNASEHLDLKTTGQILLTETFLQEIKQLFQQNGLEDDLDVDLTPKFVVGYVQKKDPHDNADKLSVCQVDTGDETLQIVCGAPNVEAGQKVVVAKPGAVMPSGMKIKSAELRGVPSSGMICSAKELELPDAPQEKGILVLDASYQTGAPFNF